MKNTTHTNNTALRTINAAPAKAAAPTNKNAVSDDAFFAEESDIANEARRQAVEVITRFLIWIAEGANAHNRETRTTIALYCVRPDLIGNPTLEKIGDAAGMSEQAAYKLARDFRLSMGL